MVARVAWRGVAPPNALSHARRLSTQVAAELFPSLDTLVNNVATQQATADCGKTGANSVLTHELSLESWSVPCGALSLPGVNGAART